MLSLDNPTYETAVVDSIRMFEDARRDTNAFDLGEPRGRWYLCGPMSDIPQYNFPTFDAAALDLRRQGFLVLSPAEMDDEESRAAALASPDGKTSTGEATWADYLKRDLFVVMEADGVIVLPGWYRSSGGQLETFVAFQLGKPVLGVYPELDELSPDEHPYQRTNAKIHGQAHGAYQRRMERHLAEAVA